MDKNPMPQKGEEKWGIFFGTNILEHPEMFFLGFFCIQQ